MHAEKNPSLPLLKNSLPYVRDIGVKNACRKKTITHDSSKTVCHTSYMVGTKMHT
jgi:hypothetical protein